MKRKNILILTTVALAALKHLSSIAESARIHYKLVRNGCPNAPAATLTDRQPVINLETYMQDVAVYSPVAGEVATVMASAGEFIGLSTPVLSILDTCDCWAQFNIRETPLSAFTPRKAIPAYIPALNRDVTLHVKYISPKADFTTWSASHATDTFEMRTFIVKMEIEACEGLRPGMSVLIDRKSIL